MADKKKNAIGFDPLAWMKAFRAGRNRSRAEGREPRAGKNGL